MQIKIDENNDANLLTITPPLPYQENMSKYQREETRMLSSRVSRRPTSPTAEDLGRIISASVLLP